MNVLNTTLGFVLCCQSPALFLAAMVLLICYFARKKNHRVRAVFDLILAILCAVGGVALYFLGMGWEYFTIRDFLVIRPIGWVGLGIVAVITIVAAVRAFFIKFLCCFCQFHEMLSPLTRKMDDTGRIGQKSSAAVTAAEQEVLTCRVLRCPWRSSVPRWWE